MAKSTVERGTRRTSPASPTRTCVRMALRGLVVAGFAGGIWLLTGSAAHAADGGHGTSAPDSTGPVANLLTGVGGHGVGELLGPAVSAGDPVTRVLLPSDATPVVHSAVTTSTTHQVADGPGTGGGVGDPGVVSRLLTPVTGATGSAVARTTGITLPKLTPQTAGWRTGDGPRRAGTTVVRHRRTFAVVRSAAATRPATAGRTATGTGVANSVSQAGAAAQPAVVPTPRVRHYRHGYRPQAGGDRGAARDGYGTGPSGSRHGPQQPGPAPLDGYPDPGLVPTGASTTSSVSHVPGGGVLAVVPTAAAGTPEAGRQLFPAAEVGRLPLIAESPTVSPD